MGGRSESMTDYIRWVIDDVECMGVTNVTRRIFSCVCFGLFIACKLAAFYEEIKTNK